MGRRLSLSVVMLVVGASLLVAAASGVTQRGRAEARKGGTLRLARFVDVDCVDPALAYTSYSWPISFATCAKLFNYPDRPGAAGTRLIPEVAKGFPRISRDGRTYTFELKQTFRFHTGAPVTARSFALAFNRDANPRMKSPATLFMHEIVGADAVIAGKARRISGVRVLGRYRLQMRLKRPLGDLTARLTMPLFCPVLPGTAFNPDGVNDPPGSGPYYVAERIPNRRIVLRRNRFYRGGRPANVDQVVWTIGESAQDCLLATEQNRIDHCVGPRGIPPTEHRRLAEQYRINRKGGQFFRTLTMSTFYFAFNHDRPAFQGAGQIPLKKAINYAIDRPQLARAFGYLGAQRTDQMLPPALGRDGSFYPLAGADPATARRWLAKARRRPAKLVLYTTNDAFGVEIAQTFAFDLRQIGIDVEPKYFDFEVLMEKTGTLGEPFDVAFVPWAVDYADPASYFVPLLSGTFRKRGNLNYSYFRDSRVNARVQAANRLTGAARRRAWADLDAYLMRTNPPWAPAFHRTSVDFVSRSFGCFLSHPVYKVVDLAAACKK